MIPFQTLHTFCQHNKDIHYGVLTKKEVLTELETFKLSYFGQLSCTILCGVCVITFYSFQWILFKLYTHGGLLQMCVWLFDIDQINFDRITAS